MSNLSVELEKNQKGLGIIATLFCIMAYAIGLVTLGTTIYLVATPHGEGAWLLPTITFVAGALVFLFLLAFSKTIQLLITISKK